MSRGRAVEITIKSRCLDEASPENITQSFVGELAFGIDCRVLEYLDTEAELAGTTVSISIRRNGVTVRRTGEYETLLRIESPCGKCYIKTPHGETRFYSRLSEMRDNVTCDGTLYLKYSLCFDEMSRDDNNISEREMFIIVNEL